MSDEEDIDITELDDAVYESLQPYVADEEVRDGDEAEYTERAEAADVARAEAEAEEIARAEAEDEDEKEDEIEQCSKEYRHELDGYYEYDSESVKENRRQRVFRDFMESVKPILYDFLTLELSGWENHFEERAGAIVAANRELELQIAELNQKVFQLTSLNKALEQREASVVARERMLDERERNVAVELSKIEAIRASLSELLDRH